MNALNRLSWIVGFLQLAILPLLIIGTQNLVATAVGRNLIFLDVVIAILISACVLLLPLSFLDLLPLGAHQLSYGIAAMVGGFVSVPLTRFVRNWPVTKDYFR